jgi:hypothetical protein
VFGTPDLATAMVLVALSVAILLALLSYHTPGRSYGNWGISLLVIATVLALLSHSLTTPGAGTALAFMLVSVGAMMVLLTYQSRAWAHAVWWTGVVLFFLALPFLGAGRGDLALLGLIGGPGLLMMVAGLRPEVPAFYSRIGSVGNEPITPQDLAAERNRYTRLAGIVTIGSLVSVWLFGGVPRSEVVEAAPTITVDEAAASTGAGLFQQYGCITCHSVTSNAPGVGPGLKGVAGQKVRLDNGATVYASEEYIQESILSPDAKTVSGFSKGVMASAIAPRASEIRQPANLKALVEYVESLK